MENVEDETYIVREGDDVNLKHVSPMSVAFCKIEGPYDGDKLHFSTPRVRQHPDVVR